MKKITVDRILKHDGTGADTAIASTANAYTRSHKIAFGENFCLAYRAKSTAGTPDIDLYLEHTHVDPEGVTTGENAAGDNDNGWVQVGTKIADITDELWHNITISPLTMPYIRFLCDGQGSNPADCTLELRLSKQENLT